MPVPIYSQKRQGYSNPNIRSEMFNPHREEAVSSFIIDPTKQLRTDKDARKDFSEHRNKRTSVSGPLIHGPAWAKSGKELGDSNRTNLSKLSGLVLARTTAPSEDQKERPGTSRPETTRQVGRFQGSFDGEDFTKKQDQMRHTQRIPSSHQIEDEKPNLVSFIFLYNILAVINHFQFLLDIPWILVRFSFIIS